MDGDRREPNESPEPAILGSELAAASAIEKMRLSTGPEASPLDGVTYDQSVAPIASASFSATSTDDRLRSITDRWAGLGAEDLAEVRTALSMGDFYTLIAFAHRSLLLGLRSGDPSWPRSALNGLTTIAFERVDYRDLTLAAGVVAHALGALGQDVTAAFRTASARGGLGTTDVLHKFANQSAWTLAQCGYEQVGTGPDTTLVRRSYKPYEPKVDLGSIARRIAVAVEADGLAVRSISIATDFPAVWLRGSTLDHARLAVAAGPICAVLISKSVMRGEPGLESNSSLQRFSADFAAAIRAGDAER